MRVGNFSYVRDFADDGDLVEPELVLTLVVINEGDGVETKARVGEEFLGDHLASGACSDDDRAHVVVATATTGVPVADSEEEPWGDDEGAGKEGVEGDDGDRDPRRGQSKRREQDEADQGGAGRRDRDAYDDSLDLSYAGVAPDPAVEAGGDEDYESRRCDSECKRNRCQPVRLI